MNHGFGLRTTLFLVFAAIFTASASAQQQQTAFVIQTDSADVAAAQAGLPYQDELATRIELIQERKSRWVMGAVVGFVAGAGATALILHSGGSTSLCNRSENQDAMSSGECLGLTVAGGVVGAGIGAIIGGRIRR